MLKKDMKKIFENIHVFSKFSISSILLFCLIFVLYIFYQNYQKQNNINNGNQIIEQNISESIDKNFRNIKQITNEIEETKTSLKKIEKSIITISETKNDDKIDKLSKNIELLTNKFNSLANEVQTLKNNLQAPNSVNQKQNQDLNTRKELIDLILIKYENNLNFDSELNYLNKILGSNKRSIIEKIQILQNKPFFGYNYLENKFEEEASYYFKNSLEKNKSNFFTKIILPYINISPTSENNIDDNSIELIKNIKLNIKNKKIDSAFKNISQIKDSEKLFKISINEMKKYINFKKSLISLN